MILRVLNHSFHYECENLCRVFYPNEKITIAYDEAGEDPLTVVTKLTSEENGNHIEVESRIFGSVLKKDIFISHSGDYDLSEKSELEMAKLIFYELSEINGYVPSWGVLTGVRPSKLMMRLVDRLGEEGAKDYFENELLVSGSKTALAFEVAEREKKIVDASCPDSFSLYVSIPFCPSRCSYCSFVSHSITNANARKIFPDYLSMLHKEIEHSGLIASRLGLRLESIYFGGGTPGVLSASQLDSLQCIIENSFDLSSLREYTVEIGRPDTVTPEKLNVLRLHNTDRISINPQTFNQKTLDLVGRKHTVKEAVDAFRLAKSYDFKCINMDLIAGLPEETLDDYISSVDTAISLEPENITVHTLALKRSSTLNYEGAQVSDGKLANDMLEYSGNALYDALYKPYYMYRQSKCVGNLENVGWCRGNTEGLYNVYMMEECHTVIACGAGAVTKLCDPYSTRVDRIFNFKYPYEYITGFDTVVSRKDGIEEFYENIVSEDVNPNG